MNDAFINIKLPVEIASGSVVECLTWDRGVAGSSPAAGTV